MTHRTTWKALVMKAHRPLLAAILVSAIGVPLQSVSGDKSGVPQMTPPASQSPIEGGLLSLASATAWLNSPPLTPAGLRGKVVLIDFWTYTCINWLRSLPYVRAWAEKYKDHGLVVIGVHSPEFASRERPRQRSPSGEGHEGLATLKECG